MIRVNETHGDVVGRTAAKCGLVRTIVAIHRPDRPVAVLRPTNPPQLGQVFVYEDRPWACITWPIRSLAGLAGAIGVDGARLRAAAVLAELEIATAALGLKLAIRVFASGAITATVRGTKLDTIEYEISPKGDTKVNVVGAQGRVCTDITKQLDEIFGRPHQTLKPEYLAEDRVVQTAQA